MRSSNNKNKNNSKGQRSIKRSDEGVGTASSTRPSSLASRRRNSDNKKSSSLSLSISRIAPPPPPQQQQACDIMFPPAKNFASFDDDEVYTSTAEESQSLGVRPPPTAPHHQQNQHYFSSYYQLASNSISAAASIIMTGDAAVPHHHSKKNPTTATETDAYATATATASPSRRSSMQLPPPMAVATMIGTSATTTNTTTPTSTASAAVASKKPSAFETAAAAGTHADGKKLTPVETEWTTDLDRRYDLTPVSLQQQQRRRGGGNSGGGGFMQPQAAAPPSYFIDPWEVSVDADAASELAVLTVDDEADPSTPHNNNSSLTTSAPPTPHETDETKTPTSRRSTFVASRDIHPSMEHKEEEIAHLRLLAGKLNADWRGSEFMAPALARRIRDFQFAQEKRRRKYGDERPWGILGLYDHLSAIRTDVEWAEDQAWRRANGEPYMSWADFDESKRGGYNRPFFTYILLITCTIIMIASIAVNGWKVEPLPQNPMIGPSAETLIVMGAKDTALIVEEKEGWRLLSSAVLHAGLVHFLINMLALWFVGAAIETTHGWFAAMVIFCISAVGGTILSAIFLPEYITVGASGGIFGFIGACCADIVINWRLLFCDFVTENGKKHRHILVVVVLLLDIILNSIIGLTPYVDNFTHLGGMAYGFLCGLSTIERLSSDFFGMEEGWFTQVKHFFVRFFGLIISIVSLVITLILLLGMDAKSKPCPNCTWLSCVPFPPWAGEMDKWWYCDDCGRVTAEIVSRPYRHLELDCPDGSVAEVNFTSFSSQNIDRTALQKQLPTYCREYCLVQEGRN